MVDDNTDIRKYLTKISERNFQVFALSGKPEAERLFTDFQPLTMRSDLIKRDTLELEFSNQSKFTSTWNRTPVIILIASTTPEITLKELNADSKNLLVEPFDKELLLEHVHNLLQNREPSAGRSNPKIQLRNTKSLEQQHVFLEKVTEIVEKHLDNPKFNVQMLAEAISMSHSNFYRKIKSLSGQSANEFIRLIRLKKVAQLLAETECNVSEAAFAAGFNDIKYFRAKFFKLYGMRPSEYKKKYFVLPHINQSSAQSLF